MTSVTFEDYTPPARYQPVTNPWTQVEIQEAITTDSLPSTIETITFSDPDLDPETPMTRFFTTEAATLENGWYRVRFLDAQNDSTQWSAWVQNLLETEPTWKPTVQAVADLLYTRTKDHGGNYVGTFTEETNPTNVRVSHLINVAQDHVISDLNIPNMSVTLMGNARHMTSLYAAMLIELSHYSEQVTRDISPYKELRKLYEAALAQLEDKTKPGDGLSVLDSSGQPTYHFDGIAVGYKRW